MLRGAYASAINQTNLSNETREQELLQLIHAGDSNATWTLLERHTDLLYRCCLRSMGGKIEETRDALSQVYLKAYQELPLHGRSITNPAAWLTRLAQNHCLDLHRKKNTEHKMLYSMRLKDISHSNAPSPETLTLNKELDSQIRNALATLPQLVRTAAWMRFVENLPYIAIARQLGITQATARKRIQLARYILAQQLGSYLRKLESA